MLVYLMILFVSCMTLGSQILIKRSVMQVAGNYPTSHGIEWLLRVLLSPPVVIAILMQAVGFSVWIFVVDKMKLGVAFSLSGATFYLLLALTGWYLYGERLTTLQWLGISLVSAGVLLISLSGNRG